MATHDIAMEGIFASPETTVRGLIDQVRKVLDEKYSDIDEASALLARTETEAAEIRKCILEISNTLSQVHIGERSKESALAIVTPCVKTLKTKCETLGLTGAFAPGDDICEIELQMLLEFSNQCRSVIEEHIATLRCAAGSDYEGNAGTLLHGAPGTESFDVDPSACFATEAYKPTPKGVKPGTGNNPFAKHPMIKTANALYKQAKALYKYNIKKAYDTMLKARTMFANLLRQAKSHYVKNDSGRKGLMGVINYLEDRVDSCDAHLTKWANNKEKRSFDALKTTLKGERKAERENFRNTKDKMRKEQKAENVAYKARKAAIEGNLSAVTSAVIEAYHGYQDDVDSEDEAAMDLVTEADLIAADLLSDFSDY